MLSDLRYRLRAIFRRAAVERELDEELQFHLDRYVEAEKRSGVPHGEAVRRARLVFGGVDRAKEESRDGRGLFLLETLLRDLRQGARTLARSPGFTIVAMLLLTLGIGANTAMFQLLNALALRPLPVAHPEELVEIRLPDEDLDRARGGFARYPALTHPIWEHFRDRQEAFSHVFAWADDAFNLAPSGEVRLARGLWVSGDFFTALGVTPAAGRLLSPSDDRRGCGLPGAVVSYDFWQRELGGDRLLAGRTLTVNGHRVEVLGVAAEGFFGVKVGQTFDVAVPLCSIATMRPQVNVLDSGTTWWLTVMGRLKPGGTAERADAHTRAISPPIFSATLAPNYPAVSVDSYRAFQLTTRLAGGGISTLRETYTRPLRLLLAMTGAVLLMACANLTNLMLARGAVRRRELALRLALGASRGRLVSELLSESLIIAIGSAVAGAFLASTLSRMLMTLLGSSTNPIVLPLDTDWRVLAFTASTSVATCLILGLMPALRVSRRSPGEVIGSGSRGASPDHESVRLRRSLVVAQVALSLVLLVGALLFVRSFRNLLVEPLGFERNGVLIVDASLPPPLPGPEALAATKRDLMARLRALPTVSGVAETSQVPAGGSTTSNAVWLDGVSRRQDQAFFSWISPGYFATLEIPLVAGRDLLDGDTAAAPMVAVVNESFARTFTNGTNPVGRRFWVEATPSRPETLYEIVGLVRDTKYQQLREAPKPVAFLSLAQREPRPGALFLVRASSAEAVVPMARQALLAVNPNLRFVFRVLDSQIRDTLRRDRVMAMLSALFGLLAGVIAAIGLHGVVSYMVERRRREIGIRLALGATRSTIVAGVFRESGRLVAAGLAAGILASLVLTRSAATLLFELTPHDPATLAMAVGGLAVVAGLASYLPARRAAHVDPAVTLKDE
jgi:predicted permease